MKYIKLNLKESLDHVDRFIICEFNRTHIGGEKELVFQRYLDQFTPEERKKILYIGADIAGLVVDATSDSNLAHHKNERIIRGYFARQIDLKDEDIVFSVDADEIVFRQAYKRIIATLESIRWPFFKSLVLPMHQFFYRVTYLWENLVFAHAVACKAGAFRRRYPSHWREKGRAYAPTAGCHFSWCLTVDEMMQKLGMYAHHHDYAHLAKREILEEAIRNKTYPFDPEKEFRIKVLDIHRDGQYYPQSLYGLLDEFAAVLGEGSL